MKNNYFKLYWSKILITICTIFLICIISYVICTFSSNSFNENSIKPFELSNKDIKHSNFDTIKTKNLVNKTPNSSENDTIHYTIKNGDTLFSICRKYMPYMSTDKAINVLKDMNKIPTDNTLKVNQSINIPNYNSNKVKNSNITSSLKNITYTVKPGDTLFSICQKHVNWCSKDTAIKQIIKANNLNNSHLIKAGQKLIIPYKIS